MDFKQKVVRGLNNVTHIVGKHSPLILTGVGVLGLGATAVFSYKAAKKVEVIVTDIEESNNAIEERNMLLEASNTRALEVSEQDSLNWLCENTVEMDRMEIAKRLLGATALPIVTGVTSIAAIILSYKIQTNRIGALAATLATATAEKVFYEKKFRKEFGDEKADHFYQPTEVTKTTVTDDEGNESTLVEDIKADTHTLHGVWFDRSTEYASDDHTYNIRFIRSKEENLSNKLFSAGWLRMNEVFDALGLPRTRAGELFGWSVGGEHTFFLEPEVTYIQDPITGEMNPQIYVKWNTPQYIYDEVEYKWN